jgi:UDP-N-acetylmuramate: L-alanyl-gamma-D-glutamyl-meso-diaminopimelate ligase
MNVFPTYENYLDQFRIFIAQTLDGGSLIYCSEDPEVTRLVESFGRMLQCIPYALHPYRTSHGKTCLIDGEKEYPVAVFGRHNMQNISAAKKVCEMLGINDEMFFGAIRHFRGAGKRMQLLQENEHTSVYLDFAHAPSKVKATTSALKELYPERWLTAVLELHTFSSLNADFLPQYSGTMQAADKAIAYFNPHTVAHKKLPEISADQVKEAFRQKDLWVYTDAWKLIKDLQDSEWKGSNLLIMTSGNFDGQDLDQLAASLMDQ